MAPAALVPAGSGSVVDDRYLICESVGEGGMGRVFRAEQTALARSVAVKFLRADLAHDPVQVRRFHDEGRAASRLSHPNSVAIIDTGTSGSGEHYLVMEYVNGPTLSEVIHRQGPLAIERTLALVDQILSALEAAHAAGVVHADIKSDNILLEADGAGGERVKIIDFGLARLVSSCDPHLGGVISGTPEYIAPEVIRGELPTPAADLYAVGIVLFELLTGTTPFAGGSPAQVYERHLRAPVIPPSLRWPERPMPPALERVVLRALSKRAEERFRDARSFRAALDTVRARIDPRLFVVPAPEPSLPEGTGRDAATCDWRPTEVELVA
jgi:serine/threonine protein kinase